MKNGYFSHIGVFELICDFLLLTSTIILIVGQFMPTPFWTIVGFILFAVSALTSIVRAVIVIKKSVSRNSPEFKNAITNIVIMSIIVIISVIGAVVNVINF